MQAWPVLSLCAVLAVPPASAAQARWVTISHANGERIEIDTADVGITGSGHITVWWRLFERAPRTSPSPESPTTRVRWSSLLEHEEIDCHAGETRLRRQILYNAAGDAVSIFRPDSLASSFESPAPESIMEGVMNWACKHF